MLNTLRAVKNNNLLNWQNALKYLKDKYQITGKTPDVENGLKNIFCWIEASFKATNDGGSSAYYRLGKGWKASYPETTGYLIPTLYEYSAYTGDKKWALIAKKASDWLISIQSPEGGWQGLQVDEKAELRVFNTGMILDGLVTAYKIEKDERYLSSAIKGMNWILGKQDKDGFFSENNVSGGGSFDTLVCAGLLMVAQHLPNDEREKYYKRISVSLEALKSLQMENTLFQRCSFQQNNRSLLHHIGYTLDGLIISSEILDREELFKSASTTARKLLSYFEVNLQLPAYFNNDWTPHKDLDQKTSSLCLTGYSQISIVFQKIFKKTNDLRYLNAALKINDLVSSIGNHNSSNSGIKYGLTGSFPIFGIYQPYQFVNWAAKYHAEALLLSRNANIPKKMKQ